VKTKVTTPAGNSVTSDLRAICGLAWHHYSTSKPMH
jgi:hypothetical protein